MARQLPFGELRKMFGYDALFVNGNMAIGLWQNTCVAKLAPSDRVKLLESGQARPFAPAQGRAMGAWLELSEDLAHDPEELLAWGERAVQFVATLPPKAPKAAAAARSKATKPSALKSQSSPRQRKAPVARKR